MSPFGTSRELAPEEVRQFLLGHSWGTLATAAAGQPYAVPVVYGFDGKAFYVASKAGRKLRNLEANPAACLTILTVEDDGACWRSVVVTGRVKWVTSLHGRLAALAALRRQRGNPAPIALGDVAHLAGARVLRIVPDQITGRTRERRG